MSSRRSVSDTSLFALPVIVGGKKNSGVITSSTSSSGRRVRLGSGLQQMFNTHLSPFMSSVSGRVSPGGVFFYPAGVVTASSQQKKKSDGTSEEIKVGGSR